jgi:hypothetical protein
MQWRAFTWCFLEEDSGVVFAGIVGPIALLLGHGAVGH